MRKATITVLVVDDEQALRETLCRGLFLLGHRCLGATGTNEALELLGGPEIGSIDLLVTDLTMPNSSGLELIEQARQLDPNLPIIVITGLTSSSKIQAVRERGIPILQKPFNPDQLEQAIDTLLGRSNARDQTGTRSSQSRRGSCPNGH